MVTPGECQLSCRKVQKMTTMVEDVNDLQNFGIMAWGDKQHFGVVTVYGDGQCWPCIVFLKIGAIKTGFCV